MLATYLLKLKNIIYICWYDMIYITYIHTNMIYMYKTKYQIKFIMISHDSRTSVLYSV